MVTIISTLLAYLRGCGRGLVTGWDHFFFAPKDPALLGVIRIVVGSVLFYIHISCIGIALDLIGPNAWVDLQGLYDISSLPEHKDFTLDPNVTANLPEISRQEREVKHRFITTYGFSLWFAKPIMESPTLVLSTYIAGIVCVGLFTVGLFTPVMGVIAWAFHLSYLHRSLIVWFGMDAMLSFLLLYLMLSPCGRAFSLDQLLIRRFWPARARSGPTWSATVGLRLIQLHMCVVYFIAGVAKLQGSTWWEGTATWLTMQAPLFNENLNVDWIASETLGEWFWQYVTFFTTYATLAFEICFLFLIWNRRLRPWFLFAAFVLHLGIGLSMGLGAFGVVMLAGCLSFIPASGLRWFINTLLGRKSTSPDIVV